MKQSLIFLFWLLTGVAFSQTNRAIDSLEKLIGSNIDTERKLYETAILALEYQRSGYAEKAEKIFKEGFEEAKRLNLEKALATFYHTRGTFFYFESRFDSSLYYLGKALSIRKRIKDNPGILKSSGNMGGIYFMLGDHKKALMYYEEALRMEAELKYKEGEFVPITNVGFIYASMRINSKALEYFRKAEKIYKNSSNGELIYVYDGLSTVYRDYKKFDSAIYYGLKAKEAAEALNDVRSVGYELVTIGLLYNEIKKYGLAKESYKKALELALLTKDERLELTLYANMAVTEMDTHGTDSAFPYLEKVIGLQKKLDMKNNRADLAELFAKYYFDKKDYKQAVEFMKMQNQYKDSLYNVETASQISEMQAKYETEKKEKENQLLQSENRSYRTSRNYLVLILVIAVIGIIGAIVANRKIKNKNVLLNEQKNSIEQKNDLLEEQKKEIVSQKEIVEEKQKEILDSIRYAKRIQYALLASDGLLQANLPEHFILFQPKDVVSGDFYWAASTPEGFIYVTADCTGHGVPGAFMSLLNISKLSQVVNEHKITRPDMILNTLRTEIIKVLNPKGSNEEGKDGMDAVVCKLDRKKKILQYAAANNSLYIVRDNVIIEHKADKMPVGKGHDDSIPFTFQEVKLLQGDTIYTFTDGFADQFGGTKGKKFKYKQLEEMLLAMQPDSMENQKEKLKTAFENWKGKLEQVDDVCIIGVRV